MDFWKSLTGMVAVELTSADISAALGAINCQNITLQDVRQIDDLTVAFCVKRGSLPHLATLAEKRGEKLRITRRQGLYWTLRSVISRPVLLLGFAVFLAMVLYLPTRVFFIRVDGNKTIPTRLIIEAAEKSGIQFGASRREVRSEKVKNGLLAAIPQLQWAGVNTSGCVAVISIRERSQEESVEEKGSVSSIVASRDGYVVSATATQGNLLCKAGQAVTEGQVLISGYTDCGICIQATRAEGEIFAQTNRDLTVLTPATCLRRHGNEMVKRKISVSIGKKRINLWKDSGIWDTTCGRMYEEYYITLPDGFRLPIALCVETYTLYEKEQADVALSYAEIVLADYAAAYLKDQMAAGTILTGEQSVTEENGCYQFEGTFVCVEMIGRVQQEQIGEENGKSD